MYQVQLYSSYFAMVYLGELGQILWPLPLQYFSHPSLFYLSAVSLDKDMLLLGSSTETASSLIFLLTVCSFRPPFPWWELKRNYEDAILLPKTFLLTDSCPNSLVWHSRPSAIQLLSICHPALSFHNTLFTFTRFYLHQITQ